MTNLLHILLGAALVSIGVLAAAVSDRIRGIRFTRERSAREPVHEHREPSRDRKSPAPTLLPMPKEGEHWVAVDDTRARDIVAALMSVGYKKPAATEAVMGCSADDRATLESWTAAALRRAGKVVAS